MIFFRKEKKQNLFYDWEVVDIMLCADWTGTFSSPFSMQKSINISFYVLAFIVEWLFSGQFSIHVYTEH